MNKSDLDESIQLVAADTLEKLALMYLVEEDEASGAGGRPDRVVSVDFTGPFDGRLVVAADDGFLGELAANMLGLPDAADTVAEQREDALKEFVNVLCGNLLSTVAGPGPIFSIGAPAVDPLLDTGTAAPVGTSRLRADAGVVEVAFFVNEPAALAAVAVG